MSPKIQNRPNYRLEQEAGGIVAGIDEAGRGPLAGPVVAAALILNPQHLSSALLAAIDDSKALSVKRRNTVASALLDAQGVGVWFGIGAASVFEIDQRNILQATFLAMQRALIHLPLTPNLVLIDGNHAPRFAEPRPFSVRCIVKGDQYSLSIAAASILAKTTRDRVMQHLDIRYPAYGWGHNAGYGTNQHRAALTEFGTTRHHRLSFKPIKLA